MRCPSLVFALLVLSTTSAYADVVVRACDHDAERYALLGMGAALFGACALIRYTVRHFQRVRDAQLATPVPTSLLVAERIARAVQRRAGVIATVGIVGVPALVVMHSSSLAILSTIVGCVGLRSFFIARGMLELIERSGSAGPRSNAQRCGESIERSGSAGPRSNAQRCGESIERSGSAGPHSNARVESIERASRTTAEVLGQTLIVRSADEEVSLDVSPRALAAARRHAVPTSIATRR
jgi:hypothetical protein